MQSAPPKYSKGFEAARWLPKWGHNLFTMRQLWTEYHFYVRSKTSTHFLEEGDRALFQNLGQFSHALHVGALASDLLTSNHCTVSILVSTPWILFDDSLWPVSDEIFRNVLRTTYCNPAFHTTHRHFKFWYRYICKEIEEHCWSMRVFLRTLYD